jgi:hypothetical protein
MKHLITTFLTICLFLIGALTLHAQDAFWSETFASQAEFEANWITGGTNSGPEDWTWDNDPTGIFNGQPDFASTTADNGFIFFNSDANGNAQHDVTVTSPSIDCSGQNTVILRSEHQYGFFSDNGVSVAQVGVSTDGQNFTYYDILTDVVRNDLSDPVQIVQIELPEAVNQPQVFIQFRWQGFFEYSWRIDDVSLLNEAIVINDDAALVSPLVAPNFSTPESQIDTLSFITAVANNGLMEQTNLLVTVDITGDNGDVFSEEMMIDALAPGDRDTLIYEETFVPSGLGNYIMTYDVSQDAADQFPIDNTFESGFVISEDLFAKDDGTLENATQPGDISSGQTYQMGNYFVVNTEGYRVNEAIFSVASDNNIHQGQEVSIFLYRIEDSGDQTFDDMDVTTVGFATYTFDEEEDFDLVTTPLTNPVDFTQNVPLPVGEYLLMVQYTGDMFCPYSGIEYGWDEIATVVRDQDGDWFLGGFGDDVTAIVRLRIESIETSITQLPELAGATLEAFPNPANTSATVNLQLEEQATQADLSLINALGQVLTTQHFDHLREAQTTIEVAELPAGTYTLQLITEKGFKTTRLVVQ